MGDTDTPTPTDTTDTTARGPLTPSPPLLLRPSPRLIPTTDTTVLATTATDTDSALTVTDTPTPTATTDTTARGPLMPSPLLPLRLRLLLIPTTDTATVCTDTTVRCPSNLSQPKTSLEFASRTSEKWIATFGLIPTSATVSVPPCSLKLEMVSR